MVFYRVPFDLKKVRTPHCLVLVSLALHRSKCACPVTGVFVWKEARCTAAGIKRRFQSPLLF